jgi:Tol biopolymer transport system component
VPRHALVLTSLVLLAGFLAEATPASASPASVSLGGKIVYSFSEVVGFGGEVVGGLEVDPGARVPGPSRQLSADPAEQEPAVSPDGQRIAFIYRSVFGSPEPATPRPSGLAVMNRDGSGLTILDGDRADRGPAFSPDGESIAFARGGSIFVIGTDGSGLHQVVEDQPGTDSQPAFSADGQLLAFTRGYRSLRTGRRTSGIYSVPVGGGPVRVLVDGPRSEKTPAFSPNGRDLAYNDERFLVLARADGSAPRRLNGVFSRFSESHNGSDPAFSPDSRFLACLAYSVHSDGYETRLAVIGITGRPTLVGTIRRAGGELEGGSELGPPAWSEEAH